MITTLPYTPTKQGLFQLLLTRFFKKKWWLYALVLVMGILDLSFSFDQNSTTGITLIVCGILLPLSVCLRFWYSLSSKDNKVLYLSRHFEIDYENIRSFFEDGSTSTTKISNFTKSELIQGQYLIFITKTQYILIPVSTFKSQDDLNWFTTNTLGKISMPGFL